MNDIDAFERHSRSRKTDVVIHAERINDCAKLIMHRLAARHIRRNPESLKPVRDLAEHWMHQVGPINIVSGWSDLLKGDPDCIAERMTARTEFACWLRLSSPMLALAGFSLTDVELRRRIWRMARKHEMMRAGKAESLPL
jgi:hypothetical protein